MSHGTGSYFVVVSPEELRRRALTEQRRRCSALGERLARAKAEAAALGAPVPAELRAPVTDDLEEWTAHASHLAAQVSIAQAAVQHAQRVTWVEEISNHLAGIAAGITLDIRPAESAGDHASSQVGAFASPADELKSSLEAALAQAAFITDAQCRSRLVTIAEDALRLLATDLRAARGRLAILRTEIHRDLAEQARREKLEAKVQELLFDASGLPSEASSRVAAMAASARTPADLAAIQAAIDSERKLDMAQEDRRVAIRELTAALTRMGYEIGEEFEDALTSGRTIIEPPDLPGYGIELQLQDGRRRLLTETIALTADTRGDLDAQAAGCDVVDQLSAELAAAGVRLDRYYTARPGQMPMQREVRKEVNAREAARRRRRPLQQERHL
ncbi:hypothetical protein [Nocardioides sp. KR10-350]|uniref:hypothetical protein n=1 Tax=Nocardioides cheoyonin TaxID=3156615 RepID=UPI0032B5381C